MARAIGEGQGAAGDGLREAAPVAVAERPSARGEGPGGAG
jgi:hypothetical protein